MLGGSRSLSLLNDECGIVPGRCCYGTSTLMSNCLGLSSRMCVAASHGKNECVSQHGRQPFLQKIARNVNCEPRGKRSAANDARIDHFLPLMTGIRGVGTGMTGDQGHRSFRSITNDIGGLKTHRVVGIDRIYITSCSRFTTLHDTDVTVRQRE